MAALVRLEVVERDAAAQELVGVVQVPSAGCVDVVGATEVFDVSKWGTQYDIPVGTNTAQSFETFEYTGALIMAAQDGTQVDIDTNADGAPDITRTLNAGETYHVNGGLREGAGVSSTAPIQLHLITGDLGSRYESRWYAIPPTDSWSDAYYSPVGTANDGDSSYVYLYNPGTTAISVAASQQSGCTNVNVPAGGFVEVAISVTTPISAAEFSTEQTCGGPCGGPCATRASRCAGPSQNRRRGPAVSCWSSTSRIS